MRGTPGDPGPEDRREPWAPRSAATAAGVGKTGAIMQDLWRRREAPDFYSNGT